MKIVKPKIKTLNEIAFNDLNTEEEICNFKVTKNPDTKIILEEKTIDSFIFEKIDFKDIELIDIDLTDVIFDGCDLSNKDFNEKYLSRVVFKNCKMLGTSFIDATLKDIEFGYIYKSQSNQSKDGFTYTPN